MAVGTEIKFANLDQLYLDPLNPRLGRNNTSRELTQEGVLDLMRDWTLDELAVSFLESGFWPQEAVIVVEDQLYGQTVLVVVEGNRRLAALKLLRDAAGGRPISRKWADIVEGRDVPAQLFERIPYVQADSREDVQAFLGFRHVTGIKEWRPAEKAEYITMLIDQQHMSYQEVMRKIGSKVDAVRRNYVAFRIFNQMERLEEEISLEHVEEKFSVLFLSLREAGVQRFLGINMSADPSQVTEPVPMQKLEDLTWFSRWMFGSETDPPLFTDSRNVGRFARVLESPRAVQYLKESEQPSFDLAVQKAGADEPELVERVERATDEVEQALGRVHLYLESRELQRAVDRFAKGAFELVKKFPAIYGALTQETT